MGSTTQPVGVGQFSRSGDRSALRQPDALTDAEVALLHRARAAFRRDADSSPTTCSSPGRERHPPSGSASGVDDHPAKPDVEPAALGRILLDALTDAEDPAGIFAWPAGTSLWANRVLDGPGTTHRPFMELLDEWSQAHFVVRALPVLLRAGRWRGQLGLLVDGTQPVAMSTMLLAHRDEDSEIDSFSLVAHRLDAGPGPAGGWPGPHPALAQGDSATRMLAALVQHVNDLIVVADATGSITFASSAATGLLGISAAASPPGGLLDLIHPDDRPADLLALARPHDDSGGPAARRLRVRGVDDSWRHLDMIVTDLTANPAVDGVVINARDVTDEVETRTNAAAAAYLDELTGLPNRMRLLDRLESVVADAAAGTVGLLLVDLDHFRRFNESHGPSQTDAMLVAIARRLAASPDLDDDAFVARIHSDEFAIVLTGVTDLRAVAETADRLRQEIASPLYLGSRWEQLTASVGVALLTEAGTPTNLLTDADWAMRRAKDAGRNRTEVHDATNSGGHRRQGVDDQLVHALDGDGLRIWYQPVFDIATDRVVGAEALLRVRGERGELLPPGAFIEAAESNGLIARLGASVLRTACRETVGRGAGHRGPDDVTAFEVSVNVSPRQVADPDYAATVITMLEEAAFPPDRLWLEITEGAFLGQSRECERNIVRLRDIGVRIGLDDFGGGSTSLGHLRRLPLDFVKIDRSLVAGVEANYVDGAIVRSTVELARRLGLTVIAVGVETEAQLTHLRELGCQRAQGYLFAPAVGAAELAALVP